jgi:transposase
MTTKNRYARRSKISEAKFRALVKLFALDLEATQIAELANLNRNTVNRFLFELSLFFCRLSSLRL